MFFMGGMTMGYLQPPLRAKKDEPNVSGLSDDNARRHPGQTDLAAPGENPMERTLMWARRILC